MADRQRIVFMGSPQAAVPALRVIAADPKVEVAAVFAQPERPVGRGRKLRPCPVVAEARAAGFALHTPERIREPEALAALEAARPDLIVVCAYGQILPERVLALPPLGAFNLHFSLLPRWRGASPVQAALLAGDSETGVSLQRMVLELDAGPIAAETEPMPIAPAETAETLTEKLALAAAGLLEASLPQMRAGTLPLREQDAAQATFCKTIRKEEGRIDWERATAVEVERRVRAYTPWPGCFSFLGPLRLGLEEVELAPPAEEETRQEPEPTPRAGLPCGTILAGGLVRCREGFVRLVRVKPAGKGAMPFAAFLNGTPSALGGRLTAAPE